MLFLAAFLFAVAAFAQNDNYIDAKALPLPDGTGKTSAWATRYKKVQDERGEVVVIPDRPSNEVAFGPIVRFYKNVKKESELTPEDFEKAMTLLGNPADFKDWERFGVPIRRIEGGFEFKNERYTDLLDGICVIVSGKMVLTGNSIYPISLLTSTYQSYDYMLIESGLLSKMAISEDKIIDVKLIRETNYNRFETKFFDVYVDKHIPAFEIPDSIVLDIARTMALPMPDFKIVAYIHDDSNAARMFANFYFMMGFEPIEERVDFGTVQLGAIHAMGANMGLIRHESFHLLWNRLVDRKGDDFFSEGIQTYYEFLKDENEFVQAQGVQQRHPDFDLVAMITSKGNFWSGPSENGWPVAYDVSGLFVKFLIDSQGLDMFKAFFQISDNTEGFRQIYGMTPEEIAAAYRRWFEAL
jgi:hypothetical protein